MKLKEINDKFNKQTRILFKVVDKLEQRISTLEKVLQSHAKCIGELRVQTYMETKGEDNNE